jgi:hypothetical protein
MILELCVPHVTHLTTEILCLSTAMKSVVGSTQKKVEICYASAFLGRHCRWGHQSLHNQSPGSQRQHGGDFGQRWQPRDSRQSGGELHRNLPDKLLHRHHVNHRIFPELSKTCLCSAQWVVTFLLIILHLYSNYQAVTALIFKNLNDLRMTLVLKSYLIVNAVLGPERINKMESVLLGFGTDVEKFCGFKIILGRPLRKTLIYYNYDELRSLTEVYKNRKYLLVPDLKRRAIFVTFEKGETPQDVIAGYYNAVLLGLATCIYNRVNLVSFVKEIASITGQNGFQDIYSKRQLHQSTPVTRLNTFMKTNHNSLDVPNNIPPHLLLTFNDFVDQETDMFFTALQVNGRCCKCGVGVSQMYFF